ncbi:haloacid dehalogenase [Kineobactrum sediminis]|uniref:Haloacid dehalogenase n=1 Tax=Kineobactrum sediminis TaxID=1905677 RepID=A0A2N5Y246_9GAMM|nr:HAD-IIB family hydrolase [Kineobactrum sediminis]PLW82470.1 haloacid dehalogenase [Kineobactrum sediminis]
MELVVFDLDGTLLDKRSQISPYTRETLQLLAEQGIAYTVATGRTLHAARDILDGHGFSLPQIYKNGVMIWCPKTIDYSFTSFLTQSEIQHVLEAVLAQEVTPFIFTLEPGNRHAVYHTPLRNDTERRLAADFAKRSEVAVLPVEQMPATADITNISALGAPQAIRTIATLVDSEENLVAYSGDALEGPTLSWIDIHHSEASKGSAVTLLKAELGIDKVVCFGDSDNDLSMFALADECYAPENAKVEVKTAASAIIGHHDEDGIAHFLRERFELPGA